MKTLLVWGASKDGVANIRPILMNLRKNFVDVKWEWEIAPGQDTNRHLIPSDCEFVLILITYLSHPQAERIVEQAKRRNIPVVRTRHRWSVVFTELQAKGYLTDDGKMREVMAAPLDKAPEALVVGGSLEDRPEVYSRMIRSGWKVKEHWLSGEGGHEYSVGKKGIKMIVVLRDSLENKQYQQAHTLAQLSRVPIIKWDISRELFRKRLEQQNLLFAPLNIAPPPTPPEPMVPTELTPGTIPYDNMMLGGDQKPIEIPRIERRVSVPATSAFDSLVATSRAVIDELFTNPLFNGVTIKVNENGSAEIIPRARSIKLDDLRVPEQPKVEEQPPPPPVPEAPKPRHVFQPVPPKYEAPPPKPVSLPRGAKGRTGRGKGHLKGQKLVMDCRYPGCKTRSLGPRYGFMCKAHEGIPTAQKKEYQKLWNATHINP